MSVTDLIGRLLWAATSLCAGFSMLDFFITRAGKADMSAPQLAALAAQSLTIAVLPYVIARAWDEVFRPWQRQ